MKLNFVGHMALAVYLFRRYVACEYGRTAVAQLLLSRGANVEFPMASGATALVIAAQKGYREIVRSLLQHGAQTDVVGAQNMAALHLAAIGICLFSLSL